MTIKYPEGLPVARRSGRTYQIENPLQRTELSSGRARQRRRFTSVPEYADLRFIFTDVQGQAFEAWWRDALIDGSRWFEMPLRTPLGFSPHMCRFTAPYAGPTWVGNSLWSYTGSIELRERAAPPVGEGLFPDDIIYSELFDKTINWEWPTV